MSRRPRAIPERLELRYAGSAGTPAEWPATRLCEIALAGRSNAGKSSLLNRLAGARLARVARDPGRTRRLQFFEDERAGVRLVDLPGYGFAKVSKKERRSWGPMIEDYLAQSESLRAIALLLDARRDPDDDERMLASFVADRGLALIPIATKVDRFNQAERSRRRKDLDAAGFGPWAFVSARSGEGVDELLECIATLAGGPGTKPR